MQRLTRLPRQFTLGRICYLLGIARRRAQELVAAWVDAGLIEEVKLWKIKRVKAWRKIL